MGEIVNLNKARKKHNRAEAQAKAAENRIRHGRSRAAKREQNAGAGRQSRALDGKKLERD